MGVHNGTSYYLCDGSATFQKCKSDIEASQACECLASTACDATTYMIRLNSKACQDACSRPASLTDMCSDYDDAVDWCSYYAVKQCILHRCLRFARATIEFSGVKV